jgi:hypothetical protein
MLKKMIKFVSVRASQVVSGGGEIGDSVQSQSDQIISDINNFIVDTADSADSGDWSEFD